MNPTLPPECLGEYDGAAEWCARRGLKGDIGDPMPENMGWGEGHALPYIQADPDAFRERVRQCAYALAMERTHARSPGTIPSPD